MHTYFYTLSAVSYTIFHICTDVSFVPSLFQLWASRESLDIPASRRGRRLVGWDEHLSPLARTHSLQACLNHFETSVLNYPGLFTWKVKSLSEMSPNKQLSGEQATCRQFSQTALTCSPSLSTALPPEHLQGLHHPARAANTQGPAQSPALPRPVINSYSKGRGMALTHSDTNLI